MIYCSIKVNLSNEGTSPKPTKTAHIIIPSPPNLTVDSTHPGSTGISYTQTYPSQSQVVKIIVVINLTRKHTHTPSQLTLGLVHSCFAMESNFMALLTNCYSTDVAS